MLEVATLEGNVTELRSTSAASPSYWLPVSLSLLSCFLGLYLFAALLCVPLLRIQGATEETVLVMPRLGIQVKSSQAVKFYAVKDIDCVLINELFENCRVVSFLTVLLRSNPEPIVLFSKARLTPREQLRAFDVLMKI